MRCNSQKEDEKGPTVFGKERHVWRGQRSEEEAMGKMLVTKKNKGWKVGFARWHDKN